MHEFKLTIKLDNKDYCDGCPLKQPYDMDTGFMCRAYSKNLRFRTNDDIEYKVHRLQACKESEASK